MLLEKDTNDIKRRKRARVSSSRIEYVQRLPDEFKPKKMKKYSLGSSHFAESMEFIKDYAESNRITLSLAVSEIVDKFRIHQMNSPNHFRKIKLLPA